MAAGIRLTITVGQELHSVDQAWKLEVTASQAKDTGGVGVHDNSIFVKWKTIPEVVEDEFRHVAKPEDMAEYPNDRDKVPPKGEQYFRDDNITLYTSSAAKAYEWVELIKTDIAYFILSLDSKEIVGGTNIVDFGEISEA
jgi:hypothetical protein